MNKFKKIATAVVATVMAGTIVIPFAACNPDNPEEGGEKPVIAQDTQYDVTLNMNVGYTTGGYTSISYKNISGAYKMSDGITYRNENLKPAWHALSDAIQVSFKDVFTNVASGSQVSEARTNGMQNYDVLTGSNTDFINYKDDFLNLNDYLERMPNYKEFLENDVATHMSILADTTTGAMYYAPYFDGQDAVERYDMANRIWVEKILDGDTSSWTGDLTWNAHLASRQNKETSDSKSTVITSGTAATSFMGKTGSWQVDATDPTDSTNVRTVKVTVNYDAALTAAKNESAGLGAAYKAAAGAAYSGTSGNIVDIMNAAIAANGNVKGNQLAKILQEYIKVTYTYGANNTQLYGAGNTKLSDIFSSTYACWDADVMTAMWRCVVTAGHGTLGTETPDNLIWAYAGRNATSQRSIDMVRFAGTLYGIRGLESKYQYTYFNEDGAVVDARSNEATYDALAKFGDLGKEGLVFTENNANAFPDATGTYYKSSTPQLFMTHDYSQSQTVYGLTTEKDLTKYNFGPIVTPVSKWDTTGKKTTFNSENTEGYTVMRFMESWRAVKTTGFALAAHLAEPNESAKLEAALKFVDYLYSNDGQILMCFGTLAEDKETSKGGFWYGEEQTDVTLATVAEPTYTGSSMYKVKEEYQGQYLVFNNKVYTTETLYNGKMVPTLTQATLDFFMTGLVEQSSASSSIADWSMAGNYSNFSEYVIGSCLPIGVKSQGFEAQMTAECGKLGVEVVGAALGNGTIQHVSVTISDDNYWGSVMPSSLPLSNAASTYVKDNCGTLTGTLYGTGSKAYMNLPLALLKYGYNTNVNITNDIKNYGSAAACVAAVNNADACNLNTYVSHMNSAWNQLKTLFGLN